MMTTDEPEHTHGHGRGVDEGRLPGYTVGVDWWDVLAGQWVRLRPYVSAQLGAARCAREFAQDQRVFFTFVMYDRQPQFLRALGTHLSQWDAVAVRSGLERRALGVTKTPGENRLLLLPVDDVRMASQWHHGDVGVLFPTSVMWTLQTWLQASGPLARRQRVLASVALRPTPDGVPSR